MACQLLLFTLCLCKAFRTVLAGFNKPRMRPSRSNPGWWYCYGSDGFGCESPTMEMAYDGWLMLCA